MRRLLRLEPGHRVHDAAAAPIWGESAEGAASSVGERRRDDEVAVEALAGAKPVGRDLVADRARHAVAGHKFERTRTVVAILPKYPSVSASCLRRFMRSRHMAGGALVLDLGADRGMVAHLSANAGEHVRISCGVCHDRSAPAGADRHVFPGRSDQVVVAGETLTRHREHRGVRGDGTMALTRFP